MADCDADIACDAVSDGMGLEVAAKGFCLLESESFEKEVELVELAFDS